MRSIVIPTYYETLTVTNSAVSTLTAARYLNGTTQVRLSDYAFMVCETANVRYTVDGSTPPTSGDTGMPVTAGQNLVLNSFEELQNFKVICDSSSASASLRVSYYKS